MLKYVLWMVFVSVSTGETVSEEKLTGPISLKDCNDMQMAQGVRKPEDGKIPVFECRPVRVD